MILNVIPHINGFVLAYGNAIANAIKLDIVMELRI